MVRFGDLNIRRARLSDMKRLSEYLEKHKDFFHLPLDQRKENGRIYSIEQRVKKKFPFWIIAKSGKEIKGCMAVHPKDDGAVDYSTAVPDMSFPSWKKVAWLVDGYADAVVTGNFSNLLREKEKDSKYLQGKEYTQNIKELERFRTCLESVVGPIRKIYADTDQNRIEQSIVNGDTPIIWKYFNRKGFMHDSVFPDPDKRGYDKKGNPGWTSEVCRLLYKDGSGLIH